MVRTLAGRGSVADGPTPTYTNRSDRAAETTSAGSAGSGRRLVNPATRITTTVIGVLLALGGLDHGVFEILHGNAPTGGVFIQAIDAPMQWWIHGGEEAFTLVPNFLATGVLAVAVSVGILVLSLFFIDRRYGMHAFLLLCVLLTLVGGGVGHVPFFLVAWAYGSRMRSPLAWWRRSLRPAARRPLAALWPYTLAVAVVCWLGAVEIAIWGFVPGRWGADAILAICWSLLLLAMVAINLGYVCGFARDVSRLPQPLSHPPT